MPRVFLSAASITYLKRNSKCACAAMTVHGSNSFQFISSPQLQAVPSCQAEHETAVLPSSKQRDRQTTGPGRISHYSKNWSH
jgi:hypothetical protein